MKNRFSILVLIISLTSFGGIPVFGQKILFNKVPIPKDNSYGMVTGITQSKNGLMWLSTKNGLLSYDGYQMKTYLHSSMNPNTIASNDLETIFADTNGILWIGNLGAGLDRYDPETALFTHFRHDTDDPNSLSNDTVTSILRDKQGILWIGTHGGLDKVDAKTGRFIHYRHNQADSTSISCNQVRSLYEDRQGIIWVGTGSPYLDNGGGIEEGGLNRMDKKNGRFTRYLHDPNNNYSLMNNKVRAIYEDRVGTLWIGTGRNGLHKMDRTKGSFERIEYDPNDINKMYGPAFTKESPVHEQINFIIQDAAGNYWIGSTEGGLNYYNPTIGKTISYNKSGNSSQAFIDNGAWAAFNSRDGILWISSNWLSGGNLYRIDPFYKEMEHTKAGWISSFYEEPGGTLWINGKDGELSRIDPKKGVTKNYKIIDPITDWIRIVTEDSRGNIWVGTSAGLKLWNRENETFSTFKSDPHNIRSLSFNMIHTIYEDRDSNLWIGTNKGFNLRDSKTGLFTRYYIDSTDTIELNGFSVNSVAAIYRDKKKNLWIGTWMEEGGVYLFDHDIKQIKVYLKGTAISCMFEDADGVFWLGTISGLYKFDYDNDTFVRYYDQFSQTDIPDVSRMVEDNQKFLWLQTSVGMMRLNPRRDELVNFGISKSYFDYNSACYKGRDGRLYFTEAGGYYSFDPTDFTQGVKPPEIIFTGFGVAGKHIIPGTQAFLKEELSETAEIKLKFDQNIFSFDFAVVDYSDPEKTTILYMLEPYDENWRPAGSVLKAYYFNIPSGKYVFRVKAANSKGASAEKKMNVIILPPWWQTWWAIGIYGALFGAIAFTFYSNQKRRIIKAERQRTQKIELAQAKEIEKAYHELKETQAQLIQSEKMASLGELTVGIAHEIQNPLNFVNNFSEINQELIADLKNELTGTISSEASIIIDNIGENEQKISEHGQRADAIVKSMLMHSRSSKGQKELTDVNALAEEYLKLSFHGMRAKDKSFSATMKTEFDSTLGKMIITPQDIGRVLLNLYNNAFYEVAEKKKISEAGYEPTVTVTTKISGGKLQLNVHDNGRGIPEKIRGKIFQPFFTTKPSGKGAGLGLSLSYDIIKAHGGDLTVDSKEGEYTDFILQLPYEIPISTTS